MKDKIIEINRYDKRALSFLSKFEKKKKICLTLSAPYKYYFSLFKNLNRNSKILELGAGFGQNTAKLIKMNYDICATDISQVSVKVMKKTFKNYKNFSTKVADMEQLPFKKQSFDVICSAGSLSYGDNKLVMNEIFRVLKKGGKVIFVDSLNHNIIYKFNRYINYLKGKRSKSTLKWMPDLILIEKYFKKFGYGKVKFFGSITWCFPILKLFLTSKIIYQFSNWLDKKLKIKKSAFKFVLVLKKKN